MAKIRNCALVSALFIGASLGSAMAADMAPRYAKAPVVAPVVAYSWTGCYIGVEGGGAWGRSRHDGFPPGPIDLTRNFDVSGGLIGVEAGCNYQIAPSWAVGVEGDISWTNKNGSAFDLGAGGVPTFRSTTQENWIATFRGRIGPTWDRLWLYGTAGGAVADVQATLNTNIVGFPIFQETVTHWGWTAGVGLEYAITNNWTVKGEYLYVRLQNEAFRFGNNPQIIQINAQRSGVNLDNNIVRVGLNYKFGGPVVARY
jgi:outer membrane immunogenic protein